MVYLRVGLTTTGRRDMWTHTRADSADPPILPRRPLYLIQFRRPLLFPLGRESVRPFGSCHSAVEIGRAIQFTVQFTFQFTVRGDLEASKTVLEASGSVFG